MSLVVGMIVSVWFYSLLKLPKIDWVLYCFRVLKFPEIDWDNILF